MAIKGMLVGEMTEKVCECGGGGGTTDADHHRQEGFRVDDKMIMIAIDWRLCIAHPAMVTCFRIKNRSLIAIKIEQFN